MGSEKTASNGGWQSRIVEQRSMPVAELKANPLNWRRHPKKQRAALAGALADGCRPDAVDMNTPANAGDIDHPCPKPTKLWTWLIERLSFDRRDIFYEPFCGSGTTIIACEQLGRKCHAIELSPGYVAVALQRWADATGGKPEMLSAG